MVTFFYGGDTMIETRGLRFKDVVEYPDMMINDVVMSFIVGRSGIGKSVLLKLLNSMYSVDDSMILIDNEEINDIDPITLRKDYLLCGQNVFLYPGTIRENFDSFYTMRKEELLDDASILSFLSITSLDFPLDSKVDTMSGGERQRVFIAIMLSLARKVIMLDEPTSALDKETGSIVMAQIKEYCFNKGLRAFVISHDESLVEMYQDQIINLNKGDL